MSDEPTAHGQPPPRAMVALSAATYAQREGKILILKRAMGEVSGGWYIPGGAVDPGEGLQDAARRELKEETGLTPSGPLALIGLVPMHVYGTDLIQATYACDCPAGEVSVSAEHSDARWIDPREYRDLHFREEVIAAVLAQDKRVGSIIQAVRDDLDRYLGWCDRQFQEKEFLEMRSKLIALMYQSWADLDHAVAGLTADDATARHDGGSSIAWTVGHVTHMLDSWIVARFQGLPPHPVISNPMFRTGGTGEAKDWPAISTGVKEVRDAAKKFLDRKGLSLDRVIPYDGSIEFLRPVGLSLHYAVMRIAAHHFIHAGEIVTFRSRLGHVFEESKEWGRHLI